MNKITLISLHFAVFFFLTIVSQIGGLVYLTALLITKKKSHCFSVFIILYLINTYLIVPQLAPLFGRETVVNYQNLQPASFITRLLNRNYVVPDVNKLLKQTTQQLATTEIVINYLDANFPFIDKFPLLPHLSHNDGKKIDLSLIYETIEGKISSYQKSNSGYGVFVPPKERETNQPQKCISEGYIQYDYPKYLSFGQKNKALVFSQKGTKKLLNTILKQKQLQKLFIEPHLKQRLKLKHKKIRYHGCRAVRHDDHIHLQVY